MYSHFTPCVVFLAIALWNEIIFIEQRGGIRRKHLTCKIYYPQIETDVLRAIQTEISIYFIYLPLHN